MTEVVQVNQSQFHREEEHKKSVDGFKLCNYVVPWWVVAVVVLVVMYLLFETSRVQTLVSNGVKTVKLAGPAFQTLMPQPTPAQTRQLFRGY